MIRRANLACYWLSLPVKKGHACVSPFRSFRPPQCAPFCPFIRAMTDGIGCRVPSETQTRKSRRARRVARIDGPRPRCRPTPAPPHTTPVPHSRGKRGLLSGRCAFFPCRVSYVAECSAPVPPPAKRAECVDRDSSSQASPTQFHRSVSPLAIIPIDPFANSGPPGRA